MVWRRSDQGVRVLARGFLALGLPGAAIRLAKGYRALRRQNAGLLPILAEGYELRGRLKDAAGYRAEHIRQRMPAALRAQDLTGVLKLMAEMEETGLAAQYAAGRAVAEALCSEAGRGTLLEAARTAQESFRDSAFLSHLISMCAAMQGDHAAQSEQLAGALETPQEDPTWLQERRGRILEQSWRVVDLIARENMEWSDDAWEDGSEPRREGAQDSSASQTPLTFKEHALQTRQRETYLEICDRELAEAESLQQKLAAIQSMLRASIRHSPDYVSSFALARTRLEALRSELPALFVPPAEAERVRAQVSTLGTLYRLSLRLKLTDLTAQIAEYFEELSQQPQFAPGLWSVPAVLVRAPEEDARAARIMGRIQAAGAVPQINTDMLNYFRWAQVAQDIVGADAFFEALPGNLERRGGLLYYVNMLQRQGRVSQARDLLMQVHGQALANPSKINANTNYSLIKRAGELAFLEETAALWLSVPQPQQPRGLVVIPARNIDALRRYPIMVLLDLKRRGWAVVPLLEGLLPPQPTGDSDIDLLAGAFTPNQRLSPAAQAALPELDDCEVDPARGQFRWRGVDLSHAAWEDAAINRRCHTISYACPEMQDYLGMLMRWTELFARALDYVQALHRRRGLPVMHMSLFNARLPDALYAAYCRIHGDPEGFFHVHVANGYQNYFTNFSTNLSERFVLRNTTAAPETRSASFPRPENFERYFMAAKERLPEIRERFNKTTQVRRSTEGQTTRLPEATAALEKIDHWRKNGGRVACAFGKVVCDSAVPFDGGPAHRDMRDWITDCVQAVAGSDTLLLIKPHPHELNNKIATFLNQYFTDLIDAPINDNVMVLQHRWFDIEDLRDRVDLGLIYNGTTAVELGLMGIPCLLAGHFAPIDYPIGHPVVQDRAAFAAALRFEQPVHAAPDLADRAAVWLDYMASQTFTLPYRYHARPVTNTVMYPPWWIQEDLALWNSLEGDPAVTTLTDRALGLAPEPGGI